jgi:hypothetical protein
VTGNLASVRTRVKTEAEQKINAMNEMERVPSAPNAVPSTCPPNSGMGWRQTCQPEQRPDTGSDEIGVQNQLSAQELLDFISELPFT